MSRPYPPSVSPAVSAAELRRWFGRRRELAVIDVRDPLARTTGHLALSAGVPLHELEQRIQVVVPHKHTPIVLASDPSLDARAQQLLRGIGYTDVAVLEGGIDAWVAEGERVYTGTNVRSKTLGEWIEAEFGTRTVDSATVQQWRDAGEDVVVLDSRPHGEYVHHHIPGGYDTGGGAELAFRGLQAVPSPDTRIVVNCAGRTRGIVGAQSLINTGIVNPVYSLHNGTPAWGWAGLEIEHGEGLPLGQPEHVSDELRAWAHKVLEDAESRVIDGDELARLRADDQATTYVVDVRRPEEHAAGHVPGSLAIQGGQLVQSTDEHIGVRRSRIVLVDTEDLLRSASTVQWLRYLHEGPVDVIVHDASLEGDEPTPAPLPDVQTVSAEQLGQWLTDEEPPLVIDLRGSTAYAAGHVPGSVHARREHLPTVLKGEAPTRVVLVGDATFAPHFVAAELASDKVFVLDGDLAELPATTEDPRHAGPVVDQVGPPEFGPERDRWYEEYFEWEYSLVPGSVDDPDFAFEEKKP